MIIEKLETRQQWLCVVNEIQYVRTQIHWNNDIQDDVTWHLNKDYVQGEIYLNEEELEELFKNKEVMKKEQTIEQASEYYAHNYFDMHETNNYKALKEGFVNGAKWQQERMYSEKEVRKITLDFFYHWWNSKGTNTEQGFDEWFEEFKNKQETLEEVSEMHFEWTKDDETLTCKDHFISGAKWQQQQMYSEEEVQEIISKLMNDVHCGNICFGDNVIDFKVSPRQWFEQYKNK